jgi:repressor LexA
MLEEMMIPLTQKQARILEFIQTRIDRRGCPPTVREIGSEFRLASTHGVRCHLKALEKKGYLEIQPHSSRGIILSPEYLDHSGLPIIGHVAAGAPIMAEAHVEGYLSPDLFFPKDDSCFCLRVHGNSMKDAGILSGDIVVVRKKEDFTDGEIGVVILDNEATVKKLYRREGKIELVPANEDYKASFVEPPTEFRYAGEVISVHRNLK